MNERLKRGGVLADEQRIERHGLARAILRLSDFPFATRERAEVAIARGVDEDRRAPRFPARLRFGDHRREPAPVAIGRGDPSVQLEFHSRLDQQIFEQQLHAFGFVGDRTFALAPADAAFVKLCREFLGEARLVEIEQITEQSRGPHAAQAAAPFKQTHPRSAARRGDRRSHACRTRAADDDIGVADQRDLAPRLRKFSRSRCRIFRAVRQVRHDSGACQGGAEKRTTIEVRMRCHGNYSGSSVRKGDAGRPAPLKRLPSGFPAHE